MRALMIAVLSGKSPLAYIPAGRGLAIIGALFVMCAAVRAAPEELRDPQLQELIAEALRNNPELQAARSEFEAARSRVSPAGALDDPMLELGVLNVPVQSLSLRREDMTMKMIGLSQRLPYPGKRALRRELAEKDADALDNSLREAANRVMRDVKVALIDLSRIDESVRLVEKNRRILAQFLAIAEARYAVGQGAQADVLKAQTQLSKMLDELIKLERERPMIEAELSRALGRRSVSGAFTAPALKLRQVTLRIEDLRESARGNRPQLLVQQSLAERSAKALDLARKDYYPDFDVRFSYGQRDNFQDMRREDLISFTVAINLPVWREAKRDPRVAEAQSMRDQALHAYEARLNEVHALLRQQAVTVEQSLKSVRLYESGILPQARLTVEASLAAYQVNRVDAFTLLDNQMTVLNYELANVANLAAHSRALAEIEFLTGRSLF